MAVVCTSMGYEVAASLAAVAAGVLAWAKETWLEHTGVHSGTVERTSCGSIARGHFSLQHGSSDMLITVC